MTWDKAKARAVFMDERLPSGFWDRCIPEPNSGCWIWIGAVKFTKEGRDHGGFYFNRRNQTAHRVAYEVLVHEVGRDLVLDHLCRNPRCVNPCHLEPVPQRTNVLRGTGIVAKGYASDRCKRGHVYMPSTCVVKVQAQRTKRVCTVCAAICRENARNGTSPHATPRKLTADVLAAILAALGANERVPSIAERLGLSTGLVYAVRAGSYRHISDAIRQKAGEQ